MSGWPGNGTEQDNHPPGCAGHAAKPHASLSHSRPDGEAQQRPCFLLRRTAPPEPAAACAEQSQECCPGSSRACPGWLCSLPTGDCPAAASHNLCPCTDLALGSEMYSFVVVPLWSCLPCAEPGVRLWAGPATKSTTMQRCKLADAM